jgi:hypothetical protein
MGRISEAIAAVERFMPLVEDRCDDVEEVERLFWIAAQVHRAAGDDAKALGNLDRSYQILRARAQAIRATSFRRSYEAISFHRHIVEAHEAGRWP